MPVSFRCLVALLAGLALLPGCARPPQFGEVDGTLRMDGKPIANVFVTFQPEDSRQPQSTGLTDDSGKFKLHGDKGQTGVVVGECRVTLIDAARPSNVKSKDDDEPPPGAAAPPTRIPPIYSRPDKTPLRQTVNPGSQEATIEIRSTPKS
jgi:hypothetical protein